MAQALIVRRGGGAYSGPPEFTYTGQYSFVDEGEDNWHIYFLTSGTFTLLRPNELLVDLSLVGGGGGGSGASTIKTGEHRDGYGAAGGAGGKTFNTWMHSIAKSTPIQIIIGAG